LVGLYQLKRRPAAAEIFNPAYLPPAAERKVGAKP